MLALFTACSPSASHSHTHQQLCNGYISHVMPTGEQHGAMHLTHSTALQMSQVIRPKAAAHLIQQAAHDLHRLP